MRVVSADETKGLVELSLARDVDASAVVGVCRDEGTRTATISSVWRSEGADAARRPYAGEAGAMVAK